MNHEVKCNYRLLQMRYTYKLFSPCGIKPNVEQLIPNQILSHCSLPNTLPPNQKGMARKYFTSRKMCNILKCLKLQKMP